jgi:hypothetical protein
MHTLDEYLRCPASERQNDEAAVVDTHFTQGLLAWLGYTKGDWIHDRTDNSSRRPDFRVAPTGAVVFVIEDKNTAEDLTQAHVEQMRRYTAGTAGYAIWTNACEIAAFRFSSKGTSQILLQVAVPRSAEESANAASYELLHMLFRKERYTLITEILERIAVPEERWERTPISADHARENFIGEARNLLAQLATAARAQIEQAESAMGRASQDREDLIQRLQKKARRLVGNLRTVIDETERAKLTETLVALVSDPISFEHRNVKAARPKALDPASGKRLGQAEKKDDFAWKRWLEATTTEVMQFRERELPRSRMRRVVTGFEIWKERFKVIEDVSYNEEARQKAYGEQVAYTFFVRLLLARILEDRGLIPRLVSDGGLADWRAFLDRHFRGGTFAAGTTAGSSELLPDELLALLYRNVSRYYKHFFGQPVFDWFEPDDYLLASSLDHLSRYDFADIQEDIIGFTYEAYIDEVARGKKGHYLTPRDVVDFILDEVGYSGREVIGRRLLDPACGSGSFLVRAARRLRDAVEQAEGGESDQQRLRLANAYLDAVQHDLVGTEINPFSCYLAELNLFIQALPDVLTVWKHEGRPPEIERFQVFNTNSLDLPHNVLEEQENALADLEPSMDEAWDLKSAGAASFHYVVANPPYVNRGIVTDAESYGHIPFYRSIQSGEGNLFLLFLKVAAYYAMPGGTLGFIVPINILGDAQGEAARGLFSGPDWRLEAVTRFYRPEKLFEGVKQRLCILVIRRSNDGDPADGSVRVHGGNDVAEARAGGATPARSTVIRATPGRISNRWNDAWLVVPEKIHYRIWRHIRGRVTWDVERWTAKSLKFQHGDVNKTRTKVFRVEKAGKDRVPITCAERLENLGPWEPEVYIDPSIDAAKKGLKGTVLRDAERELEERVKRIVALEHDEAVFALKNISGMEPIRPLRGALYTRNSDAPVVFDNTLQIGFALTAMDNRLARAVFGLLVSAVPNYIFQLFSTNAHVTIEEIYRTPIPPIDDEQIAALESAALAAQAAGERFHAQLRPYNGGLRLARVDVSAGAILEKDGFQKITLGNAIRSGLVAAPSRRDRRIGALASELAPTKKDGPFAEALALLLREANDVKFEAAERELRLPDPNVAAKFVKKHATVRQACTDAYNELLRRRAALDKLVFDIYGIDDPEWRRAVLWGVPWAVEGREEMELLARLVLA